MKTKRVVIAMLGGGILLWLAVWFLSSRAMKNAMEEGRHWRVVTEEEWRRDEGKLHVPGTGVQTIRQILERNSPLPMLRVAGSEQLTYLIQELKDYFATDDFVRRYEPIWPRNYAFKACAVFFNYRTALLAESCPQSERDLYCDTLLNLFRLRNMAVSEEPSLENYLMVYLSTDWYGTCRKFHVTNDKLECKFMELGWYQFLRTGKVPEGWTMANIIDGTNKPR